MLKKLKKKKRITITSKPKVMKIRPQDRARKSANQILNNFGPLEDEQTTTKKSKGKIAGELVGGLLSGFTNSDSTAGKGNIKNVLQGLSEAYISECVRKYRAGETITEFERQVAKAAISAESTIKERVKARAGEWIIDHALEIGIGILVLILLFMYIKKK